MTINFSLNSRLEIIVGDQIFKSIIQDNINGSISISLPVREGVYLTPSPGEKIEAIYYDELNVYKFEALVIGRKIEGTVRQVMLGMPQNVVMIQRRKFVRVGITYVIKFVQLVFEKNSSEPIVSKEQPSYKGIILDISGGGFRMKTDHKLQLGNKINTELITDSGNIEVSGEVVRVENAEQGSYIYGLNFIELDERTREKIIQYVFTLMRKQRNML